jgi:hypothetical protein
VHPKPFALTRREVLEKVGAILQMPMVLVQCFAGLFRLEDFVWSDAGSRAGRVAEALAASRDDPLLGPLMKTTSAKATKVAADEQATEAAAPGLAPVEQCESK